MPDETHTPMPGAWGEGIEEYYENEIARLEKEAAFLRSQWESARVSLDEVLGSRAWKLSAPLRKAMSGLQKSEQGKPPEKEPSIEKTAQQAESSHSLRTLPPPPTEVSVSFIIPVLNGGTELSALLTRLKEQQGLGSIEIIVIDSGSTDGSAGNAKAAGAKVIEIPQEEFSHSHARNLGAESAKGNYLVFITQDAMPKDTSWAKNLLEPLLAGRAAAASGMQAPREDADFFARMNVYSHNYYMTSGNQDEKLMAAPQNPTIDSLKQNANLDNVNCAIRRDIFSEYKFCGTIMEDLDLGLRLTADKWPIMLLPQVTVVHSHNRGKWYTLKRSFADNIQLAQMLPDSVGKWFPKEYVPAACINGYKQVRLLARQLLSLPKAEQPVELRKKQLLRYLKSLDAKRLAAEPDDFEATGEPEFDTLLKALAKIYYGGAPQDDTLQEWLNEWFSQTFFPFIEYEGRGMTAAMGSEMADSLYKCYALSVGSLLAKYVIVHPEEDEIHKLAEGLAKGV